MQRKVRRQRRLGRFFVDDAGAQRLVGLGEGLDWREDVSVHGGGLDGAELGDGEGQRGHELLVGVDDILRDFLVEHGVSRAGSADARLRNGVPREIGASRGNRW